MVSPAERWTIRFEHAAEKEFRKLDPQIAHRILSFLYERVTPNPRSLGEPLHGNLLGGYLKYRVGDYRIVAELHDHELVVMVLHIGHRREVYR